MGRLQNLFYLIITLMTIIILLTFVDGASNCPRKCKCNETTIQCTNKGIIIIPDLKKVNAGVTNLDLSKNDIEEIRETSFKRLEKLQRLTLHDNSLVNVEVNGLSVFPNLKYLDFSNNLLDHLSPDVVKNNKKLTDIDLSGNVFGSKAPELYSTSLLHLDLSYSKISSFTEDNLKGLPNLQILNLGANNLKYLDYNIFKNVKLNHVSLISNPWKCECDTIKLFSYLVQANLTKIDRPIQCMHKNKWYEDIYTSSGPVLNRLCNKEIHHPRAILPVYDIKVQNENETDLLQTETEVFTYTREYLVAGGIILLLVCVLLTTVVVVKILIVDKKQNHIYEELGQGNVNSNLPSIIEIK